jgi:hypothetical protein
MALTNSLPQPLVLSFESGYASAKLWLVTV